MRSSEYTLPFGKHRGRLLREIDDLDYLRWLAGRDLREPLLSAVRAEIDRRDFAAVAKDGRAIPCPDRAVAEAFVTRGQRALEQEHAQSAADLERIAAVAGWLRWQISSKGRSAS